jgi:DNA-directed RNA polymerase subunit E'/Rpb7
VTGVTPFGLFIEVEQPSFDGLVRLESLRDDRFEVDERALTLTGRPTGQRFSLGDDVVVKVTDVSVARRQIELTIVSAPSGTSSATAGEGPRQQGGGDSKGASPRRQGSPSRRAGRSRRRP